MSNVYLPAVITPNAANLANLIHAYKSDPMSPYREIRHVTRVNYDGLLRRWERDHGHEAIASFNGRRLKELHAEYLGPDNHVVMAHGLIAMLRTLATYGFTMLSSPECRELKELLSSLKFKMGKPRGKAITAEQVIALIKKAQMPKLARGVQTDTINAILKMIDPGEPPCDCCTKQPNGLWTWDCDCQNSGDLSSAASWCCSKGDYERIAALKPA